VVVERVLERAGYAVANVQQEAVSCCGMPFSSKGFITQGDRLARRLEDRLLEMTRGGRYPVLCDTSPCFQRLQQVLDLRLRVYEPASFIQRYLLQRLHWTPLAETVAVHLTCSSRKMGLADTFASVARALAETVVIPDGTECCGFAGDKGFTHPELNAAALATLRSQIPDGCSLGVSNSRTCEIGLSLHSGLYYKSIFYLLDRCSRPHRKG
jgi:D-lactate dehydrogenase